MSSAICFSLEQSKILSSGNGLRTDDSQCDRIHSSLTPVHCFKDGYVGKQPVAKKEYCGEYWYYRQPGKHGWVHLLLQYN